VSVSFAEFGHALAQLASVAHLIWVFARSASSFRLACNTSSMVALERKRVSRLAAFFLNCAISAAAIWCGTPFKVVYSRRPPGTFPRAMLDGSRIVWLSAARRVEVGLP